MQGQHSQTLVVVGSSQVLPQGTRPPRHSPLGQGHSASIQGPGNRQLLSLVKSHSIPQQSSSSSHPQSGSSATVQLAGQFPLQPSGTQEGGGTRPRQGRQVKGGQAGQPGGGARHVQSA